MQLYIKAVMCQCAHCMKTKHRAVCIAACVTTTLVPVYMDPHNNILSLACLSLHACMHVNAAVHKSGYVPMCMQPSDCAEKSLHGNARVHHFREGSTRTPALDSGYHTDCNEDLRSARKKPAQTRLRAKAACAPEHGVAPTVMRTFVLLGKKPAQTHLRAKAARAPEHGVTPTVMRTFVLLEENQLKHTYAPKQRARQSTV